MKALILTLNVIIFKLYDFVNYGGLDYVQSSGTINMIITTRNPRANQYVVTKNFLFAKTTHTVLSRIYYTQDSIRNIILRDYNSTRQS
jgi:hypothetical protein